MRTIPPITIQSATLTLAYLHMHRAPYLRGRCLSNTHLRRLSAWLGYPNPTLRSIRKQPVLAANLAALHASSLLTFETGLWIGTPDLFEWLRQPPVDQLEMLKRPFVDPYPIKTTIDDLNLHDILPLDYRTYIKQQLSHQQTNQPTTETYEQATWKTIKPEQWQLNLPLNLSTRLHFHLRQLGAWMPGKPLTCTPITINRAIRRGYSVLSITSFLEQVVGEPLSPTHEQILTGWIRRRDIVTLHPINLLSTRQPAQMAHILSNRRLRDRVRKQLSPRHAVVASDIQEPLRKWLAKQNIPLNTPEPTAPPAKKQTLSTAAYAHLGMQILAGLSDFIPPTITLPTAALEEVSAQLDAATLAHLNTQAQTILDGLQSVIRGRDAFYPAQFTPPATWFDLIDQALNDDLTLQIDYQTLGDTSPRTRQIQPLHLEQRGELYYLYAYCTLAERNLTFRLDRIHALQLTTGTQQTNLSANIRPFPNEAQKPVADVQMPKQ
ncbi:MAG: WYL domain-containing protein [Anaerolineales bacterium]|nr:WYL domain-containing protein [Anaerolineales bacterium]